MANGPPAQRGSSSSNTAAASKPLPATAKNRVRLSVEAPKPGFVFLSDNYFPGWTAKVNGNPAEILRSWVTFRAVQVPAGRSELRLEDVRRTEGVEDRIAKTVLDQEGRNGRDRDRRDCGDADACENGWRSEW